jgi:hypothetical protein
MFDSARNRYNYLTLAPDLTPHHRLLSGEHPRRASQSVNEELGEDQIRMIIRRNSYIYPLTISVVSLLGTLGTAQAQEPDQVTIQALAGAHGALQSSGARALAKAKIAAAGTITATDGPTTPPALVPAFPAADTIPSFNGQFTANGFDPAGNPNRLWLYNMVGAQPKSGKSTTFNNPIIPVSLDLRNADGSPRFVNGQRLFSDVTPFVAPVLASPIYQNHQFTSAENPTQITDAVQRASFGDQAEDGWHNLLKPVVKTARVMTLIRGTYQFALNADGTCCLFVLIDENTFINNLFPATVDDTTTVIGAAEHAGDMTTQDISTLLFPNAFLFAGNPANCCVLGFHSFDFEPGIPANGNQQRFYVMNYASWISPGIFGGGFEDITALSHEMSELFADPFVAFDNVHNITPWWLAGGNCQDNLEVGDVIEGLPNPTFPITLHGFTYHPQNEALLQWFEFAKPAQHDGQRGYSFPDMTVLTALSPLERVNCVK